MTWSLLQESLARASLGSPLVMQRSLLRLQLLALCALLALAANALAAEFSEQKKSASMNEFMSAMKGAGRLRYGKRALPVPEAQPEPLEQGLEPGLAYAAPDAFYYLNYFPQR